MDVARIAPCMPGAELTEITDARNYKGKISVRLGPVSLAFAGKIALEDVDDAKHSARVKAQGSDAKGRGAANAAATFKVEPKGEGSLVLIHTDLMLSGAVAQYGRGVGMIQTTAAQIIGQFAGNLRAQLGAAVRGARRINSIGIDDGSRRAAGPTHSSSRQADLGLLLDVACRSAADRSAVRAALELMIGRVSNHEHTRFERDRIAGPPVMEF